MSKQPKALRLADFIDEHDCNFFYEESSRIDGELFEAACEATAELRRLHALNAELLEALQWAMNYVPTQKTLERMGLGIAEEHAERLVKARAAMLKAREEA